MTPIRLLAWSLTALVACETTGGGPGKSMSTPGSAGESYGLAQNAFTLVNLHPDEQRHQLYSVNYQQLGLIPRCTPVRIDATSRSGIRFTVTSTGRQYDYAFHDSMVEGPDKHLARYFGASCPELPATLNDADRNGISAGVVTQGMTKQGVVYAAGYPPEHATPTPDRDEWIYWKNRFDRFVVRFADGKVVEIRN